MDGTKKFQYIENLLKNTGWSCDELLKNIENYKTSKNVDEIEVKTELPDEIPIIDLINDNHDLPTKEEILHTEEILEFKNEDILDEDTPIKTNVKEDENKTSNCFDVFVSEEKDPVDGQEKTDEANDELNICSNEENKIEGNDNREITLQEAVPNMPGISVETTIDNDVASNEIEEEGDEQIENEVKKLSLTTEETIERLKQELATLRNRKNDRNLISSNYKILLGTTRCIKRKKLLEPNLVNPKLSHIPDTIPDIPNNSDDIQQELDSNKIGIIDCILKKTARFSNGGNDPMPIIEKTSKNEPTKILSPLSISPVKPTMKAQINENGQVKVDIQIELKQKEPDKIVTKEPPKTIKQPESPKPGTSKDIDSEPEKDENDIEKLRRSLKNKKFKTKLQFRTFLMRNQQMLQQRKRSNKALVENKVQNNSKEVPAEDVPPKKPRLLSTVVQTQPEETPRYVYQFDENWMTEVRKLPKVILEVTPQIGRPITPKILHLLPKYDGPMTGGKIDFALSTLYKPRKKHKLQTFKFLLPYNQNQETITVKKLKPKPPIPDSVVIEKILNNLITYVETKEIEDTIIKEDDDSVKPVEEVVKKTHYLPNEKPPRRKQRRVDLELRRLNCNVIEMQNLERERACTKLHCKFGCICDSLDCKTLIKVHCGKVDCMFGCTCTRGAKRRSNVPTDPAINSDTIAHLDNEKKKNLAKVEREFIQTIIHTENRTIFMGSGTDKKTRRTTKVPKKYEDFFNDISKSKDELETMKEAHVNVDRLDVGGMRPYCMEHNTYQCYCLSNKLFKCKIHDTTDCFCDEIIETAKKTELVPGSDVQLDQDDDDIQIIPNDEPFPEPYDVSRTRQVFDQYSIRNKTKKYNDILRKKYKRIQFENETRMKPEKSYLNFDGEVNVSLNENADFLKFVGSSSYYVRLIPWKSLLNSLKEKKINVWCRRKAPVVVLLNTSDSLPPKNFVDIFDVDHDVDIIRWIIQKKLPDNYQDDLVYIILKPNKNNYEITGMCLKNSKKNEQKLLNETVVIDVDDDDSVNEGSLDTALFKSDETTSILELSGNKVNKLSNIDRNKKSLFSSHHNVRKCKHKNFDGTMQTFTMHKTTYPIQKLSKLKSDTDEIVEVSLPSIGQDHKWQMVYLKEHFYYLKFKKSDYTIQHTDLEFVTDVAKCLDTNIMITGDFCQGYTISEFGIYCVPSYNDRFFIGPFGRTDDHDLYEINKMTNCESLADTILLGHTRMDDRVAKSVMRRLKALSGSSMEKSETNKKRPRYIVTNIPNLGHFVAFQSQNSKEVEVIWPGKEKLLVFASAAIARNIIKKHLSIILHPLNKKFSINVILVAYLNPRNVTQINPKYLSQHYVCDCKGVYDIKPGSMWENHLKERVPDIEETIRNENVTVQTNQTENKDCEPLDKPKFCVISTETTNEENTLKMDNSKIFPKIVNDKRLVSVLKPNCHTDIVPQLSSPSTSTATPSTSKIKIQQKVKFVSWDGADILKAYNQFR